MNATDAICLSITLAACWPAWYFGWEQLAMSGFRQSLFALRDELFSDAAAGRFGLRLDLQLYLDLRQHLNRLLQFTHHINSVSILLGLLPPCQRSIAAVESPLIRALNDLPPGPAKQYVAWLHRRIVIHLTYYVLKTSPVFFLLLGSVALVAILYAVIRRQCSAMERAVKNAIVERMNQPLQSLEAQAVLSHSTPPVAPSAA